MKVTLLILIASTINALEGYVSVPDGWMMHESCVFNHPDGVIAEREYKCDHPTYRAPLEQVYRMDTHLGDNATRQTELNASWVVPALPVNKGAQVVYYWPGFKQTAPEMGYPVFQPVLQYGQQGKVWYVQSWFVYGNAGIAHTGPAIPVTEGDEIVSSMTFDEATGIWTCLAIDTKTKSQSVLTQKSSQMDGTSFFEYSMLVLETISANTCPQLPGGNNKITFTDVTVNGKAAAWTKRITRNTCGEAIDTTADTVTMSWHN